MPYAGFCRDSAPPESDRLLFRGSCLLRAVCGTRIARSQSDQAAGSRPSPRAACAAPWLGFCVAFDPAMSSPEPRRCVTIALHRPRAADGHGVVHVPGQRQAQRKCAAAIQASVMCFDTATVELHQALDLGESDAQATACTDALRGRARKQIKHPGKEFRRDVEAAAAHRQHHLGRVPHQANFDLSSAFS